MNALIHWYIKGLIAICKYMLYIILFYIHIVRPTIVSNKMKIYNYEKCFAISYT